MRIYQRLVHRPGALEASADLALAATLHDVGKIGIPDSILRKPGKLDAKEWQVMKEHPRIGHTILSRSKFPLFQLAAEISLHHHEKWDGSGYPDGLRHKQIGEAARIVAVADVYDALTTKRPYKEPWSVEQAFERIQLDAGKHFDPHFAELFLKLGDELEKISHKWRLAEWEVNAA
jgi:putative two-component system response regulator